MVNEKIPDFPRYVKFGAEKLTLYNENDTFEIRGPQDGDEAVEKGVLSSQGKSLQMIN